MTESVIIRRKVQSDFTVLTNALVRDLTISWKALGILVFLLHLPPDFRLNLAFLSGKFGGGKRHRSGREATRAGVRELEAAGYVSITRERDDLGQWTRVTWIVTDTPSQIVSPPPRSENPKVDKPAPAPPREEDRTLISTEFNKEPVGQRTTTSTERGLHFPRGMGIAERETGMQLLSGVGDGRAQEILDELAAVMERGAIRNNPTSLLAELIRRNAKGVFTPAAGHRIASRREAAQRREQRLLQTDSQPAPQRDPELSKQSIARSRAILGNKGLT